MFEDMDAFRDPKVVELLWMVGVFDEHGRLGSEMNDVKSLYKVVEVFERVRAVRFEQIFSKPFPTDPAKIKDGMFKARVQAVKAA